MCIACPKECRNTVYLKIAINPINFVARLQTTFEQRCAVHELAAGSRRLVTLELKIEQPLVASSGVTKIIFLNQHEPIRRDPEGCEKSFTRLWAALDHSQSLSWPNSYQPTIFSNLVATYTVKGDKKSQIRQANDYKEQRFTILRPHNSHAAQIKIRNSHAAESK